MTAVEKEMAALRGNLQALGIPIPDAEARMERSDKDLLTEFIAHKRRDVETWRTAATQNIKL